MVLEDKLPQSSTRSNGDRDKPEMSCQRSQEESDRKRIVSVVAEDQRKRQQEEGTEPTVILSHEEHEDSIGSRHDEDHHARGHQIQEERWKDSPFAIGPTKQTWAEEDVGCGKLCRYVVSRSKHTHLHCTAFLCSRTGAGRVGNMVVLWQRTEDVQEGDSGERIRRPRLIVVLGPFWIVSAFVTVPFFLVFSSTVLFWRILDRPCLGVLLSWSLLHLLLVVAFFGAACRNPGIMYRHAECRMDDDGQPFIWNSQSHSYRPMSARYDPECAVVIDEFHHTCPWIGTAVGKRNRVAFFAFLVLAFAVVGYNVILFLFHQ